MKKIDKITPTKGRLLQAYENGLGKLVNKEISQQVKTSVEGVKIQTGVMTKFYPYLNKAEVKLDKSNKKIICKILHRYGGAIMDLFTPLEETRTFCKKMGEPCIIPRYLLNCLVADINDDSKEYLLLGYYENEELIGLNPAEPGSLKISAIGITNEYYIKFGIKGFEVQSPKKPNFTVGHFEDETAEVNYVSSDEVYTKKEVDKLLEDLKEEIINSNETEKETETEIEN